MIRLMIKLSRLFLQKKHINTEDIATSYNNVADTYNSWLEVMSDYTKDIIQEHKNNEKILDLCTGSGFIASELFKNNPTLDITAVDISINMLNKITNTNIKTIQKDAITFLELTEELYDAIYIGYALPYIENRHLYSLLHSKLNNGGKLVFITNISGTLQHSYSLIFDIMKNNLKSVNKVFMVKLHNEKYYMKKLHKYGFNIEYSNVINRIVSIEDKDQFIQWLLSTGAFAGVNELFEKLDLKVEMAKHIDKYYLKDNIYIINHKLMQVIATKE